MANQLQATVLVTRVEDDEGAVTDRNWLSGVVVTHRFAAPGESKAATDSTMQPPHEGGVEAAIDVVLLQHGKPRGDAVGHLEPLVPASLLFRSCAGVSHPAFTGRPSAWIPFSTVLVEKRFATPYYDGVINFDWNEVQWQRESGCSIATAAWGGQHAVIRAGSVIKYRAKVDQSGASVFRQGVVLLTYVQLSTRSTQIWKEPALQQFKDESASCEAIEDLCSTFPATPIATFCVWQLKTDHLGEGSTEWATQPKATNGLDSAVTADCVHSVALPDPTNKLWEPVGPSRVAKSRPGPGVAQKAKKAKRWVQEAAVTLATRLVDTVVSEQSDRDAAESALMEWFRICCEDRQTAVLSSDTQLQHSFYADIVFSAWGNFNELDSQKEATAAPVSVLMKARRLLNVPQRQTEPARSRNPQPHALSAIFDAVPLEPQPAAAAPGPSAAPQPSSSSRGPAAGASGNELAQHEDNKTGRKRKATAKSVVPEPEPADATPPAPRAKKGRKSAAAKVKPQATTAADVPAQPDVTSLFSQLSREDVDEHLAPFAALFWKSLPSGHAKEKRAKHLRQMEATARAEALATLAEHDRPLFFVLEFATSSVPNDLDEQVRVAIFNIHRTNSYANGHMPGQSSHRRLDGIPTRAWLDHQGQQPAPGSPSVLQRASESAARSERASASAAYPASSTHASAPSDMQSMSAILQQHLAFTEKQRLAEKKETKELMERIVEAMQRQGQAPTAAPQAPAEQAAAAAPSSARKGKRAAAALAAPASGTAGTPASAPSAREVRLNSRAGSSDDFAEEQVEQPSKKPRGSGARPKSTATKGARPRAHASPADEQPIDIYTPGAAPASTARTLFNHAAGDEQQLRSRERAATNSVIPMTALAEFGTQLSRTVGEAVSHSIHAEFERQRMQRYSEPRHQLIMPPAQHAGHYDYGHGERRAAPISPLPQHHHNHRPPPHYPQHEPNSYDYRSHRGEQHSQHQHPSYAGSGDGYSAQHHHSDMQHQHHYPRGAGFQRQY